MLNGTVGIETRDHRWLSSCAADELLAIGHSYGDNVLADIAALRSQNVNDWVTLADRNSAENQWLRENPLVLSAIMG